MLKRAVKRAGKVLLGPMLRYFDRMFADVTVRLDERPPGVHALDASVNLLGETLHEVQRIGEELRADARSLRELALLARVAEPGARHKVEVGDPLSALDQDTADLINWAISPVGMAGEGLAWLNHGTTVSFAEGKVWIDNLNERVVELPWAHVKASTLTPGSRVLDVGSTEGLLAIELASCGHHVVALDPRPYPIAHPRVEAVASPVEEWDGPKQPLDAVFAISAVEHFGLGHYVEAAADRNLDRIALDRFAQWLRPGAPLLLTVPFGTWQVTELERVYDTGHLAQLIDGWTVVERSVFARQGAMVWEQLPETAIDEPWGGGSGVVLLELRCTA